MACAQNDEVTLSVKVKDSFTRNYLHATIDLFAEDTLTVVKEHWKGTVTTVCNSSKVKKTSITFTATVPFKKKYVARVSMKGYDTAIVAINTPMKRNGHHVKEIELDDILLHKSYSLNKTLGEATVTTSRVAMVVKGDTVEYDARAFKMAEGSMLDNLLRMLPGVKIDNNGKITHNGEYVSKLLVNGNNFFKGNPKIALDNLPAYVVDKIDFYHEGPKWDYLLDEKNKYHEKKPYVVNVKLKREFNAGYIANAEVAGGIPISQADKAFYLARVFGMRFTNNSSLSLFGNFNNLSDTNSPGGKGQWKKMDISTGEHTTQMGGANIAIHGKKTDTDFSSSMTVKNENVNKEIKSTGLYRYSNYITQGKTQNISQSHNTSINWQADLSLKQKKFYSEVFAKSSYQHEKDTQFETHFTDYQKDSTDVWVNSYSRKQNASLHSRLWESTLQINNEIKSPLSGKIYNVVFFLNHKSCDERNLVEDLYKTQYDETNETRHDHKPLKSYSYSALIGRNLLDLTTKGKGKWDILLDVSYRYQQKMDRNLRERTELYYADSTSMADLLPSNAADRVWLTDLANSLHITELARTHVFSTQVRVQKHKFSFDNQVSYNLANRHISNYWELEKFSLKRDDSAWDVRSEVEFGKFGFIYQMYSDCAPATKLVSTRNAEDPLMVYTGNESLKNPLKHWLVFRSGYQTSKKQRMYSFWFRWEKTKNAISQRGTYDYNTGTTYYEPVNVNGNWNADATLNFSQSLDKKNRWNISNTVEGFFKKIIDYRNIVYGNEQRTRTRQWKTQEELKLDYRHPKAYILSAKANVSYNCYRSFPENSTINNGVWDYSYGISIQAPIVKTFILSTDIIAYAHRKYYSDSYNKTEWVWNAALSYSWGNKKQWLIKAVGFDLLHQLSSINRTTNSMGYTETWFSTMLSYATLHIVYSFNKAPKIKDK